MVSWIYSLTTMGILSLKIRHHLVGYCLQLINQEKKINIISIVYTSSIINNNSIVSEDEFKDLVEKLKLAKKQKDYDFSFAVVAYKLYGSDHFAKTKNEYSGLFIGESKYCTVTKDDYHQYSLSVLTCCAKKIILGQTSYEIKDKPQILIQKLLEPWRRQTITLYPSQFC